MLLVIVFCFVAGCRYEAVTDWKALYLEARQKADRHDSDAALQLATRGLQEAHDSELNYQFRTIKADLLAYSKPTEALQLLETEPPQSIAQEFVVRRKTLQARAYARLQNFKNADQCLVEARGLADSKSELLSHVAFAAALVATGNDKKTDAAQHFRDAIGFAQQTGQKFLEADASTNLGFLEMEAGRYDRAIVLLDRALGLARQLGIPATEQQALGNLGWSYFQIGDSEHAVDFLKAAVSGAQEIGRTASQARWENDLGSVYLNSRDYEQAEPYYQKAYSLATTAQDDGQRMEILRNLAQLELETGHLDKAEEYNEQVAEQIKTYHSGPRWEARCTLTAAEIAIRRNQLAQAEQLLKPLLKTTEDLSGLRRAQSDLANVYVMENKPVKADQEFQAAIRTVESARAEVKQEERRMSILDNWPFYDDYIRFLVDRGNDRRALQKAEHSRSRTLVEGLELKPSQVSVPELSISMIQNFLRKQSKIILAFWLANQESYLWVITPTKMRIFHLHPRQEIEQEIQAYNQKIIKHEGIENSPEGQKLYELLVRKAEKLVPKGSQVIIIPHRSLYRLNFETLVVSSPKPHYWIDDVTIETAGSMVLLATSSKGRSNSASNLLLIGAPEQASKEFGVLNHADEEMGKVAAHFRPGQEKVYPHEAATPSAFMSNQPGRFTYIHFVTHGTASDTTPLDSAIILSPQAENVFKLYARDIVGVKLNANVVTISACYGAGTKTYSGEGLVGLAWAFLRAGAHQVVAGLWEVDDQATPDLMDDFYTELKDQTAAVALRSAKLRMVHSEGVYHLPYYWASLQLYTGS